MLGVEDLRSQFLWAFISRTTNDERDRERSSLQQQRSRKKVLVVRVLLHDNLGTPIGTVGFGVTVCPEKCTEERL